MSGSTAAAEDQASVKSEDSQPGGRAKFLCSYGGRIMPRPHDSQLRYVGGETRILSVPRGVSFSELMSKLRRLCPFQSAVLKYQLPDEDLDALVSVISEEDLENMMEEYDRVEAKDSNSRLRLFLFPALVKQEMAGEVSSDIRFVDAVNGVFRKTPDVMEEQRLKNVVVLQQPQVMPSPQVPVVQASVAAPQVPVVQAVPPVQSQGVTPVQSHAVQTPMAPVVSPLPPAPVVPHQPVMPSYVPFNNVVAVPSGLHPKAPIPFVRVAAPGGVSQVVPQVLAARSVVPQVQPAVVAPARPVTPSSAYIPLVDVSRAALPKGVVLRPMSVEDDRSESPSSQSSQMNDDRRESGEMTNEFDKLRLEKVQENMIKQHLSDARMVRPSHYQVVAGQHKVEPEVVPQVVFIPESGAHRKAFEQGASAPALQSVDVPTVTAAAAQQFQRQFSDRSEPHLVHQENCLPNVRGCIGGEPVLVPLDDRFTSPVLHPLNGLRPQQMLFEQPASHVDPSQLLQKPVKMVPQVVAVNPYKVP